MKEDIDIEWGEKRIRIDLDPWEWVTVAVVIAAILFWCDVSGVW